MKTRYQAQIEALKAAAAAKGGKPGAAPASAPVPAGPPKPVGSATPEEIKSFAGTLNDENNTMKTLVCSPSWTSFPSMSSIFYPLPIRSSK